ncbi:hypothetical protein C0Q70_08998 [Pomacea canaliculata]|uniref:Uncharacterized protein n=1 Tax=Pomacea canaliculata TaxID=400727 RepID=A0A2T7P8J7_POMCA|nr:hypothetical protein C0Q70_08998 [Pomacea canaliculata]
MAECDLWGRVDGELQLGLLAVVDGQALHQERGEAGAGAAAKGVEDEEALQPCALVRQLADAVQHQVDDLLADGVVAAGVVVGGILLTRDELFRVEQLTVGTQPHFICQSYWFLTLTDNRGLQVHEDRPGHCACLVRLIHQPDDGARGLKTPQGPCITTAALTAEQQLLSSQVGHPLFATRGRGLSATSKCMSEHIEADTCYCAEIAQPRHMAALRSAAIGTSPGQQQVTPHAFLQS